MPEKNKLNKFKRAKVASVLNKVTKGKMSVADAAKEFGVSTTAVRYHMERGTYAQA